MKHIDLINRKKKWFLIIAVMAVLKRCRANMVRQKIGVVNFYSDDADSGTGL